MSSRAFRRNLGGFAGRASTALADDVDRKTREFYASADRLRANVRADNELTQVFKDKVFSTIGQGGPGFDPNAYRALQSEYDALMADRKVKRQAKDDFVKKFNEAPGLQNQTRGGQGASYLTGGANIPSLDGANNFGTFLNGSKR